MSADSRPTSPAASQLANATEYQLPEIFKLAETELRTKQRQHLVFPLRDTEFPERIAIEWSEGPEGYDKILSIYHVTDYQFPRGRFLIVQEVYEYHAPNKTIVAFVKGGHMSPHLIWTHQTRSEAYTCHIPKVGDPWKTAGDQEVATALGYILEKWAYLRQDPT